MEKYTKIKFIGSGQFGKAYLYEAKSDKLQYVIKVINVSELTPKEREDANREVEVLKILHHPNIVDYIESFEDEGNLCIVTEFCGQGDLRMKLETIKQKGETVPENQIWDWFIQICQALSYLHGSRVIHRDIKPANIFIAKDGSVRLGDFGLAKIVAKYGTVAHTNAGTIAFLAPELFKGSYHDHKCDIWALGIVLYFMTALKYPFEGNNEAHMMAIILSGIYPPLPNTCSSELKNMVGRLLNMEAIERPTVQKILSVQHIKARADPLKRLKTSYGYSINSDGVMLDTKGSNFLFGLYPLQRDNQGRYEAIASILEDYIYGELEKMGLSKLPVPLRQKADPDYDSPGTFIFATEGWKEAKQLLVFLHGGHDGHVKAGQWARRVMINQSVYKGTQLQYIERAISCGYGVIVLNSTDIRPDIEGCQSPEEHALYVWRNYISKASARQIAVKAHSDGGSVTLALFAEFEADFKRRVYANSFTGVCCLFGKQPHPYIKKVTRNWVTSDEPLGTVINTDGCDCVSAGTDEHSETPYYAFEGVFKFIAERFNDRTPGNL